jgi:hypothetical protein
MASDSIEYCPKKPNIENKIALIKTLNKGNFNGNLKSSSSTRGAISTALTIDSQLNALNSVSAALIIGNKLTKSSQSPMQAMDATQVYFKIKEILFIALSFLWKWYPGCHKLLIMPQK